MSRKDPVSISINSKFQKVEKDSHMALLIELDGDKGFMWEYRVLSELY